MGESCFDGDGSCTCVGCLAGEVCFVGDGVLDLGGDALAGSCWTGAESTCMLGSGSLTILLAVANVCTFRSLLFCKRIDQYKLPCFCALTRLHRLISAATLIMSFVSAIIKSDIFQHAALVAAAWQGERLSAEMLPIELAQQP